MSGKKLDPHEAFDHFISDKPIANANNFTESEPPQPIEDYEDRFTAPPNEPSRWVKKLQHTILGLAALILIVSVITVYTVVTQEPTQKEEAAELVVEPIKTFSSDEVKKIITTNLKAFLSAETTKERIQYVDMSREDISELNDYYDVRKITHTPAWKIKKIKPMTVDHEKIWMVSYQDIKGSLRYASYIRVDDTYLLQWASMTAYSELPWHTLFGTLPAGPVKMRGFIRKYSGIHPLGVSEDEYLCFLVEDQGKLFSELAIMKIGAPGYTQLSELSQDSRQAVTLNLGYRPLPQEKIKGLHNPKRLHILSLLHLRWQKTPLSPQAPMTNTARLPPRS